MIRSRPQASVPWWFLLSLAILVCGGCLVSLFYFESRASALDAIENAEACERLADQLNRLRDAESVALEAAPQKSTDSAELLTILKSLEIPEANVQEIQHLPAARIENTDYRRHDLALRVRQLTMEQIVRLLLVIESTNRDRVPSQLSLRESQQKRVGQDLSQETWSMDLILTRLIYDAKTPEVVGRPPR